MFAIPNIEKIKIQLIIGAIVLTIIGLLCWATKHYYDLNIVNEGKINDLVRTNKDLKKDITNLQELKKAADDTILAQRKVFENIDIVNRQHQAQTTATVKKIIDKYALTPQTPENLEARNKEISAARLVGLWATYCTLHKEESSKYDICKSFLKEDKK
jgi:hypothetical protein